MKSTIALLVSIIVFSQFAAAQTTRESTGTTALDCSKTPNPKACEIFRSAEAACADKQGPDFKACVQAKLAPASPKIRK